MRKYELICVIQPDLDEAAFNGVVEKVKGWISDSGGTVDKVDIWGRRKLAYIIKKQREGQFVLLNMTMSPAATSELERNLRFQETLCGVIATVTEGQGGCVIGPAILERTCREATGLDHIVLPHRIADLASAQWDYRDPQGETRAYYLYSCRKLLAKVVPAD